MASSTQTAAKIPVVDFSQEDCWKSGTSSWLSVRRDVCNALEEFGCFLAVLPNKVSRELNDTMFGTFNELFDFPDEIKAQLPQEKPLVEGYARLPTREYMSFHSNETETVEPNHTDKCFTGMLHQDAYGFEIRSKDNEWIGYDPLPSSLLFLAGDGLQVWSNDRIKSCMHRVILKENKVRYSFGQFFWNKGVIYVPNELTDKDHPMQYKPIDLVEYFQYYYENLSTVGFDFSVKEYCGV
ncbi:unnamed protein product [Malus baccata var. baccata]